MLGVVGIQRSVCAGFEDPDRTLTVYHAWRFECVKRAMNHVKFRVLHWICNFRWHKFVVRLCLASYMLIETETNVTLLDRRWHSQAWHA